MAQESYDGQLLDITSPQIVQIQVSNDGKVLWVNVDGVCRLRCCQIPQLLMDDIPKPKPGPILYDPMGILDQPLKCEVCGAKAYPTPTGWQCAAYSNHVCPLPKK